MKSILKYSCYVLLLSILLLGYYSLFVDIEPYLISCQDRSVWVLVPVDKIHLWNIIPKDITFGDIPEEYNINKDSHLIFFELGLQKCYIKFFPFIYRNFHEFKYQIPYMKANPKVNTLKANKNIIYKPLLYCDTLLDSVSSYIFFGLDMKKAHMSVNYGDTGLGKYEIHYNNSKFIAEFEGDYVSDQKWVNPNELKHFQIYSVINKQQWLCKNIIFDEYKCSNMDYHYSKALVKPVSVKITILPNILPGFDKEFVFESTDIRKPLGSLQIKTNFYIDPMGNCE